MLVCSQSMTIIVHIFLNHLKLGLVLQHLSKVIIYKDGNRLINPKSLLIIVFFNLPVKKFFKGIKKIRLDQVT